MRRQIERIDEMNVVLREGKQTMLGFFFDNETLLFYLMQFHR